MTKPVIVDYGAGNLRSVVNAFSAIDQDVDVVTEPDGLRNASAIVLPGVGAFAEGMRRLARAGMVEAIKEQVREKQKPYLGICLGLQFLGTESHEDGLHPGLDLIHGVVDRLKPKERSSRVPHVGWSEVEQVAPSRLLKNLDEPPVFYFVHSYHFVPAAGEEDAVSGICHHGQKLAATLERDNMFAVQFHPEKSQRVGLKLLQNFLDASESD